MKSFRISHICALCDHRPLGKFCTIWHSLLPDILHHIGHMTLYTSLSKNIRGIYVVFLMETVSQDCTAPTTFPFHSPRKQESCRVHVSDCELRDQESLDSLDGYRVGRHFCDGRFHWVEAVFRSIFPWFFGERIDLFCDLLHSCIVRIFRSFRSPFLRIIIPQHNISLQVNYLCPQDELALEFKEVKS